MKKITQSSLFIFVFSICLVTIADYTVLAQNDLPASGVGLSASYQKEHLGIQLPVWLGQKFNLAPTFGIIYMESISVEYEVGIIPKIYLKKQIVSPYIGAILGTIIGSPIDGDTISDFVCGISFGAEYFVNQHFSISIEAELNGTKSDKNSMRFNNPGGWNLNTGTGFIATIYF